MHVMCEERHCCASLKRPQIENRPSRWLRPPLELRTASLRRPCSGAAAIRFATERELARSLAWCRAGKALAAPGIEFAGRCSGREASRGIAAREAGEFLDWTANGVRWTPADHLCSRVPQVAEQHYQSLNLLTNLLGLVERSRSEHRSCSSAWRATSSPRPADMRRSARSSRHAASDGREAVERSCCVPRACFCYTVRVVLVSSGRSRII